MNSAFSTQRQRDREVESVACLKRCFAMHNLACDRGSCEHVLFLKDATFSLQDSLPAWLLKRQCAGLGVQNQRGIPEIQQNFVLGCKPALFKPVQALDELLE